MPAEMMEKVILGVIETLVKANMSSWRENHALLI